MRQLVPLLNSRVRVARSMESLAGAAASVPFPSGSRLCQALLTRADRLPVCDACLESFQKLPEALGARGGQPWTEGGDVDRDESVCRERAFASDAARSFRVYEGALARATVLRMYEGIEPLGGWFLERLLEAARRMPSESAPDLMVPVPLPRTRPKERGFNQVDLFRRPLTRKLGLPYRPVLR